MTGLSVMMTVEPKFSPVCFSLLSLDLILFLAILDLTSIIEAISA